MGSYIQHLIKVKLQKEEMTQPSPLFNQRAQVPGYCGYIPGKNSENKFGSTFGQVTKGAYKTQNESFLTTNISNNKFIQEQHKGQDKFWGNTGKITAFQQPNVKPIAHNHRVPAKKFVPEQCTFLTYEEALEKRVQ